MAELTLAEPQRGQSFTVGLDDTILVRLEVKAVGWEWAIDEVDEGILTLADSSHVPGDSARIGGGGYDELRFRAASVGTASLRLKYWRVWEGDASVRDRYNVQITVLGSSAPNISSAG